MNVFEWIFHFVVVDAVDYILGCFASSKREKVQKKKMMMQLKEPTKLMQVLMHEVISILVTIFAPIIVVFYSMCSEMKVLSKSYFSSVDVWILMLLCLCNWFCQGENCHVDMDHSD